MMTDSQTLLAGSVVSEGTLRNADLVPKIMDVLRVHGNLPKWAINLMDLYIEQLDSRWWECDKAAEVVADLFEAMNEIAPEGYHFGSHYGDGACFGFWKTE